MAASTSSSSSATCIDPNSPKKAQYALISEDEIEELVPGKDAQKTKDVIQYSCNILESYCHTVDTTIRDLDNLTGEELCNFLRQFYAGVRKSNGHLFARKSVITIRYGLQRHFQKATGVDIVANEQFAAANNMFFSMLAKLDAEGKGSVTHKNPISKRDMGKIMSSSAVDQSTPMGLQNKVFIDIVMHFFNRGRETLRNMKTSHFIIQTDSKELKYVSIGCDMQTKNRQGDATDGETSKGGRMYENPTSYVCPVASFELYLKRLNPESNMLWQRPKKEFIRGDTSVWYDSVAVGKNTLGSKMKCISKLAGCSQVYTNHCLRATSITTLLNSKGFEARHIMGLSGHKSESAIRSYSGVDVDKKRVDEEEKKREMSLTLSNNMCENSPKETQYVVIPNQQVYVPIQQMAPSYLLLTMSQEENSLNELETSPVQPTHSVPQHIRAPITTTPGNRYAKRSKPLRSCLGFHGWKDVCYSEELVKEITGVSMDTFNILLQQLPDTLPVSGDLTTENGLLVFLMKLKMDTPFKHLAAQFNVAPSTVEQAFMFILLTLAELTSSLIQWPLKSIIKSTQPSFIQRSFPQCTLVTDCLEIETEAPSLLFDQLPMISKSNSTFKAKALIGLTPNGYVCFISKIFSGSITRTNLSKESCLHYSLDVGDEVLSLQPDRYFSSIQEIKVYTSPVRPQYSARAKIYNQDAVLLNRHMDMLKQRLRMFGILRSKVSLSLLPYLDSLVHICAVLANFETTSSGEDV